MNRAGCRNRRIQLLNQYLEREGATGNKAHVAEIESMTERVESSKLRSIFAGKAKRRCSRTFSIRSGRWSKTRNAGPLPAEDPVARRQMILAKFLQVSF